MSEYPSWMKPHLRERLEEERRAAEPRTANGLTPMPVQAAVSRALRSANLVVSDIVRVQKPMVLRAGSVTWQPLMDALEGIDLLVTFVDYQDSTFEAFQSDPAIGTTRKFWFSMSWIV